MTGRASTRLVLICLVAGVTNCSRSVDGYTFVGNAPWCVAPTLRPRNGSSVTVQCEWLSEQHCQTGKSLAGQSGTCVPRPLR